MVIGMLQFYRISTANIDIDPPSGPLRSEKRFSRPACLVAQYRRAGWQVMIGRWDGRHCVRAEDSYSMSGWYSPASIKSLACRSKRMAQS